MNSPYTAEDARTSTNGRLLMDILYSKQYDTEAMLLACQNPHTPSEAFYSFLHNFPMKRENKRAAELAIQNPNCPVKDVAMWKERLAIWNAKHGVAAPTSTSLPLPPYTLEHANSDNPALLAAIIASDDTDKEVAHAAAVNCHCPREVLAGLLSRTPADGLSETAATNSNAPSDMLGAIVETCDDKSWVARAAAGNPSTPTAALEKVLVRMVDDKISSNAARNSNRPIRAALKWILEFDAKLNRDTAPSRLPSEQSDEPLPPFAQFIGK